MNSQSLINEIQALSQAEFSYAFNSDFNELNRLDYGCSGVMMEAHVLFINIKNYTSILNTSRRLAARVHKIYQLSLDAVAKETKGHFSCLTPQSFLLIYPNESFDAGYAVDAALKTANLIGKEAHDTIEGLAHVSFSIGIDTGNILGCKVASDNGLDRILWVGTAIEKAKAISQVCLQPFYVGISGTVFQRLDEDHRFTTKRIIGFKKQVEIWSMVSYQFDNVKKHLYQTNILKSFEEDK